MVQKITMNTRVFKGPFWEDWGWGWKGLWGLRLLKWGLNSQYYGLPSNLVCLAYLHHPTPFFNELRHAYAPSMHAIRNYLVIIYSLWKEDAMGEELHKQRRRRRSEEGEMKRLRVGLNGCRYNENKFHHTE